MKYQWTEKNAAREFDYDGLESREWERIYYDGVKDAYSYGVEKSRAKYVVKLREELNTLKHENERLLRENELLKEQLKDSWRDGYDASMHDRFHGTRTKFDPEDYKGT